MEIEKGLYKVRIERMRILLVTEFEESIKCIETKYVFVNDYDAFEKWLVRLYNEYNVDRIKYEKISETLTLLN